jgi:cyclophilin family peptidyl-prolyl cis-trans isomerase/HEAT repeat protein
MRKLLIAPMIAVLACTTADPPSPAPVTPDTGGPYGMTVEEEARILALEDRREHDAALVDEWVNHPNDLHRLRIALALGRIGPHTRKGVDVLVSLVTDPDRRVREMAAFSIGEIGDAKGAEPLFQLAADSDAGVAAEAVEALSKLARDPAFTPHRSRYFEMTGEPRPNGVRARAVRYLFRFDTDEASDVAMKALAANSDAVRQEGAYSLARRAYAPARDQLHLLMNDPNTLTRAYATAALGRIASPASAPLVVAALGDAHPWIRTNAAIALGRIAEKDRSIIRADDLPRIFAVADDPDPGTRASILAALGYYAEAGETGRKRLIDTLRNGSQWERELAAGTIAKHFPPDSQAFREMGELTPWQKVRVIEATAAAPHGAGIRSAHANAPEPLVRATVLGAIPDEQADAEVELIRKGLSDADVVVRANAIDRYGVLTKVPLEERIRTLLDAERSERTAEMNDARLAAIGALGKIDAPETKTLVSELRGDRDPIVRRVVAELAGGKEGPVPSYTPLPVERTPAEYEEIVRWSRQPHSATIHMTRGKIDLVLLTQDAPMTAWNFAQLANRKYFDNSSFMRVVPNFVIQGGDPRNDMNGGPGYSIRDEINLQKYTRGAVGMALSGPDTGGSQFFITHSPQPHLDGGYTIFGRVYEGMSGVVDQTERGDRVETIRIDERPAPGSDAHVSNVSLPLEVGPVTADRLLARVPEYIQRKSEYRPDLSVVEMMKSYVQPEDHIEVFMGTWCDDSQREVPKLLRISDELRQLGLEIPTTFVAVDRSKQKPAGLIAGKDLQKVATFIYYRGDRELGRIVERPTGLFEDDLLSLAAKP